MAPAPHSTEALARIEAALAPERLAPPPHGPTAPPRRGISGGALAWGLLATAAIAYLSVVLARPDLVARFEATPSTAVAEIETLRGEVELIRRDVADIKSTVSEASAAQRALAERVAALAAPVAEPMPVADPDAPPPALRLDSVPVNGPVSPRAEAEPLPGQGAAKKIAEAKVLNAPKPALETGSVKPVPPPAPAPAAAPAAAPATAGPPPFGPAVVKPAGRPAAVQIATGSSLDSLRLSWNLLSETHADKLKNLEPRYSLSVDGGGGGVVYNLMAGPVTSEAEAKKMCKALAAKAVPCKVVGDFGGAAL